MCERTKSLMDHRFMFARCPRRACVSLWVRSDASPTTRSVATTWSASAGVSHLGSSTDALASPSVICESLLWSGALGLGAGSSAGATPHWHGPPDIGQYSSMSITGAGSSQQPIGAITGCWHCISAQPCPADKPTIPIMPSIPIPTRGSPASKRIKMVSIRIIWLSLTPYRPNVNR